MNPVHEQRAAEIVGKSCGGLRHHVCRVSPQFREFERFTTAAMSAFIGPKVRRYINELSEELKALGVTGELRVMTSSGGLATPEMIAQRPATTLLSGLVAGVRGGAWSANMPGPTSSSRSTSAAPAPISASSRDGRLAEADARSAKIADSGDAAHDRHPHHRGWRRVDRPSRSRQGVPRGSAERPAPSRVPAAYGRGGTLPTVTDANLVLGRLVADNFLGGRMALDAAGGRSASSANSPRRWVDRRKRRPKEP